MSLHVFANFVTPFGTASNNRGQAEGSNTSPIQKLLWMGETHSTVSAEAIRFALRRLLGAVEQTNRVYNDDTRANVWEDWNFKGWGPDGGKTYIDDDLLGFMTAEAAKQDGDGGGADPDPVAAVAVAEGKPGKTVKPAKEKGKANVRRAVLEVTRAVSLTPWVGDVTFNAASPGATRSASKGEDRDVNSVPYVVEMHATRYQYGIALTPERLRDKGRAAVAVDALCNLGTVAGNHGRFLFDFSPEAVVLRITHDPAPRLLYCFDTPDDGKTVTAGRLARRVTDGDIHPKELIVAGVELVDADGKKLSDVHHAPGVKAACAEAVRRITAALNGKG